MSKNNKSANICITLLILIIGYGCKKLVSIDLPASKLVTGSVFSNDYTATAALTVIYSQMEYESYNMANNTGLLSDELTNYSLSVGQIEFYTNAMDATTISAGAGCWQNAYNYIYQANAVISGLNSNSGVSTIARQQLIGEAKFIRAFWHFYLTNCYGDVPLVTSTDYAVNSKLPRTAQSLVLRQVVQDLTDAEGMLNNNYVGFADTAVNTAQRVRPTKGAAAALLARTYLYLGKYDSAEAAATRVIGNSLYTLEPNLNNVFLITSQEAILQLQTPTPNGTLNTVDGATFILLSPPGSGSSSSSISPQLLSSFETGDLRRSNWIHDTVFAGAPYSYAFKYKIQNNATLTEYVMVLRLAEQYLIRAEARVHENKFSDAVSDLNVVRERAALLDYAGSMDQPSISKAILHERQVELFTEWGHRWFDLIRTNSVDSVMSIVTPQKGGTWNSSAPQTLFPIPLSELLNDPNLTQNPNY